MEHTLYHKILRVSMVVFALLLLFDGGFLVKDSAKLADNTEQYLATVISVSATIPPNELNVITAELTAREQSLIEREREIVEREIALTKNPVVSTGSNTSTYILSLILFILLALIVLNYGLDYARVRKEMMYAKSA